MFSGSQLVAHLVGDYFLQSHWMATEKTKKLAVASIHALTYSLPFLIFAPSWPAWSTIVVSHAIIDRLRIARYIVFAKNFLAPATVWPTWERCAKTGFDKDVPDWLAVWLMFIVDNILHILINGLALAYL